MFKRVIVGVDGEQGGRDAIALAKLLADQDAKMTFAHVYPGEVHPWRGSSAPYEAALRETAAEVLEQARAQTGVDAEVLRRGSLSVGRGLHELAEATRAELLVLGSSRRGVLGRVFIGDDTRAALDGAPCAVAVAPAGYEAHSHAIQRIGVGYDGSPDSEHALEVARKFAATHDSSLSAYEAIFFPARLAVGPPFPDAATVNEMLDAARDRIAALDGVEAHAEYGEPAEQLALYSDSLDLLVIGSRGYGPLGRLVHGSTAQRLTRNARCPLLVLTRAAREPHSRVATDGGRAVALPGV